MVAAAALRARFDALAMAYPSGQHGRWAAHERADALDAWFVDAWRDAPEDVALVALGGYGRRLQLPASDIDVLVVHDGLDQATLIALGERLWYPLWDQGWSVTPLVRTPAECVEAARDRLDSCTALLDARPLGGDATLLRAAVDPVIASVRGDPVAFAGMLDADRERRRDRAGSCAHDLSPDLKEGVGGLRDMSSLGWLATAVGRPLTESGLLRVADVVAIEAAEEFYLRARSAVHLETGKRVDRLTADLQPDVARGMGFVDEPGLAAIDGLMRTVFEHGRTIGALVSAVTARLHHDVRGAGETPHLGSPAAALEALAATAEAGTPATPAMIDAIESAPIPDPVVWDARVRDAFLRILRCGGAGVEALDVLDRIGRLERYMPAWRDVRCRPQRDPYHRYTVDAHLTGALRRMTQLLADPSRDQIATELAPEIGDRDAMLLGALFHDVGKIGHGDHVPIGAAIARGQLDAMALEARTTELATFMVGEHLLLPDTATRRDLTDENLVLDVAATVGTLERLAALYLLAVADAAATGPAAWTPWRQTLVRELVMKVRNVLETGAMGVELAAQLAERTEAVRALLTGEAETEVDRFVLRMPRGYFLSMEPAQAARHFHTIAPMLGAHEVRTTAVAGRRPGTYELLVVTPDRPALLASVAGALAVGGISILSAQVFTTDDRVAADLFEVQGAFEPEITEQRWRAFRTTLRRGIEGAISIDRKVEDTRRHYPAPTVQTPVTVRVDNGASDFSTVIEVGAPDRMGLLYDVTRAFSSVDLDVHLAKVATFDGRVVDAFYVRDELGRKVTDEDRLALIEHALREHLA
ncbi:MAG: HD domain-containing protein [Actinomycetota bacterium]